MEETLNFEVDDYVTWRLVTEPQPKGELGDGPFVVQAIKPVSEEMQNGRQGIAHHQLLILKTTDGRTINDSRGRPQEFSGYWFQKTRFILTANA